MFQCLLITNVPKDLSKHRITNVECQRDGPTNQYLSSPPMSNQSDTSVHANLSQVNAVE